MPQRRIRHLTVSLTLALALLGGRQATAGPDEWPTWRHDPGRSGRSEMAGRLDRPSPIWALAAGGSLTPEAFATADLDGLRGHEWLAAQGGRVRAFDAAGRVLWATPWLGLEHIVAARDLDGDGSTEVVASRTSATAALVVLRGRDGALLWDGPELPAGTKALRADTARLADLTGDGRQEIVLKPWPETHVRAYRRTLGGGFEQLWAAAYEGYSNYNPPLIADWDGDGTPEVLLPAERDLLVFDGATGRLERRLQDALRGHSYSHLQAVRAPDGGGSLLLVIGREPYTRSATLVDLRVPAGGDTPPGVLWQLDWQPPEDSNVLCPVDAVGDLDGDGVPEILLAVFDDRDVELDAAGVGGDHDGVVAPGVWSLLALELLSGRAAAHLPGWIPEAAMDLDGDGRAEVVARRAAEDRTGPPPFGGVGIFRLGGQGLELAWDRAGAQLLRAREERPAHRHDRDLGRPLVGLPTEVADATSLLVLRDADGDGWADSLERHTANAGGVSLDVSTPLGDAGALSGLALESSHGAQHPSPLYVVRASGTLQRLDASLEPTLERASGGFAAHLAVARPGPDADNHVFYCTSDGRLVAASLDMEAIPPAVAERWSVAIGACNPLAVLAVPGQAVPSVVTVGRGRSGELTVVALAADSGEDRWDHPLPGWHAVDAPVAGRVDGTLSALLLRGTSDRYPNDADLRLKAIGLADGAELWERPAAENTWGIEPLLVADLAGEGTDTVLHVDGHAVELFSARDGSPEGERPCDWCRRPLLADFDGDGLPDLLANGRTELCLLSGRALEQTWCTPKRYRTEGTETWSGVARRDDEGLLLLLPTPDGLLRAFRGTDGEPAWEQTLRAGLTGPAADAFDGPAAGVGAPAAARLVDTQQDVVLGTGEDGWVYGLDSVDGSLRWSVELGGSVEDLLVSDLDSDGEPDLLAATADGRITWLAQPTLAAPGRLREVELDATGEPLADGPDIDVSERTDALGVAWDAVPGAVGYRVTLVDSHGQPVVDWLDVPAVRSWRFAGVRLLPGASYRVRALALGETGASPPAESDGVRIVDLAAPEIVSFEAIPPSFDPAAESTTLHVLARDRSGLAFWSVSIAGADGPVWHREALTEGQKLELELEWSGADPDQHPLPAGTYRADLTVTDWSGHMATATAAVELTSSDEPDRDAGPSEPDAGPSETDLGPADPDGGTDSPDLGPGQIDASSSPDGSCPAPCQTCEECDCGCGCSASGATPGASFTSLALVLAAALTLLRRRGR